MTSTAIMGHIYGPRPTTSSFLKPFLKGKHFAVGVSLSARREDHFQKKLSKMDFPFRFCKIGLRNILFIFGRKMIVCIVLFVPLFHDRSFSNCGDF